MEIYQYILYIVLFFNDMYVNGVEWRGIGESGKNEGLWARMAQGQGMAQGAVTG